MVWRPPPVLIALVAAAERIEPGAHVTPRIKQIAAHVTAHASMTQSSANRAPTVQQATNLRPTSGRPVNA